MFTIFPRADLIRALGIRAPFAIDRYQPNNQLIPAFRRAYGERPTSPVHTALQVQGMASAAEQVGCAFAGGRTARITLLGGASTTVGVQSVATENPVVNAVLDAARQSAAGRPGVINNNGQAALVRSAARSCMRRW